MPQSNDITIPELVVFQTIKAALFTLREDYQQNIADITKSFLYKCLGVSNILQGYNYITQSLAVFITPKNANEPRYLDVSMGMDTDRIGKKMPHIHVILQNDSPKDDSLGLGSGNREPIFDDVSGIYEMSKVRRFNQQINLLISGDNSNEKSLIYHVLKSLLIEYIPYLNELGFDNVSLSGGDITMRNESSSIIYMRSLSLRFDYEHEVPRFDGTEFARKIYLAIDNINQDDTRTEIFSNYPEE